MAGILINDKNCDGLLKLYIIDSIMKTVGGPYLDIFSKEILKLFVQVFETWTSSSKCKLFQLRWTWNGLLHSSILHLLDVTVNKIDKNWQVQLNRNQTLEEVSLEKLDLISLNSATLVKKFGYDCSITKSFTINCDFALSWRRNRCKFFTFLNFFEVQCLTLVICPFEPVHTTLFC